jgi:hypothetical protein
MGVDEGNSMIMSSTWLSLVMKIIRLVMKPSLISRYHPKTHSGEGNQLDYISTNKHPFLYGSHNGDLDICTSSIKKSR